MRKLALFFIVVCSGLATPVITKGPVLSDLGHSSAKLIWQTDVSSNNIVLWDTFSHAGACSYPCGYPQQFTEHDVGGSQRVGKVHSAYIHSAPSGTTIYYRTCS